MSRCRVFLSLLGLAATILGGLLLQGHFATLEHDARRIPELQRLSGALSLTDLSLWSEARYARHPSQADLFTPFQDFPGAPEHFPAGSIVGPEALRHALHSGLNGR